MKGYGWGVLAFGLVLGSGWAYARQSAESPFVVKPYVQLGDAPTLSAKESLQVLWHTEDRDESWTVEQWGEGATSWRKGQAPTFQRIEVPPIAPHRVYRATLLGLQPGKMVRYRLLKAGKSVFESQTRARPSSKQNYRLVVFGDCAQGTMDQRAIAFQTYRAAPDMVFITGDIVYGRGRISEYRDRYFPVYNSEEAHPNIGAPLIRSTLFVAAPGNHDIASKEADKYPDLYGYFFYWDQPLNGPLTTLNAPYTPQIAGPEAQLKAIYSAAGARYPRMANFSFDYGNAHWTVLDSNSYMDWTDPTLVAWLEKDLAAAQKATWRFVAYHHPEFQSADAHQEDQWMRVLNPIYCKYNVDIVFNGHVHNYQRSYPITFTPRRNAAGKFRNEDDTVNGEWQIDKTFDGVKQTRANAPLYVVTGGGGASLYDMDRTYKPSEWKPFTANYIADIHSLTCIDVSGTTLVLRQISQNGRELDRMTLTKPKTAVRGVSGRK